MLPKHRTPRWAVLLLMATACADQPTALFRPPPLLAKGGPQPSIPLVVTVVATPNIASDGITESGYGAGEYVSGSSGMVAELDDPGNLQLTPGNANSTVAPLRTLSINYGAQLTSPNGPWTPNMTGQHNFKIKTGNAGKPRIQDLGVGASDCYPSTIASESGGSANPTIHHRAEFNSVAAPGATYARVTRTSATTWTMVSDGGCGGSANVAGVKSQDITRKNQPLVSRGNFVLQFSLGLRVK